MVNIEMSILTEIYIGENIKFVPILTLLKGQNVLLTPSGWLLDEFLSKVRYPFLCYFNSNRGVFL